MNGVKFCVCLMHCCILDTEQFLVFSRCSIDICLLGRKEDEIEGEKKREKRRRERKRAKEREGEEEWERERLSQGCTGADPSYFSPADP